MFKFISAFVATSSFVAVTAFAQTSAMPISTDGTDPKTWDPRLDAVIAGVKNHKIIYEDKEIRVLSVMVLPGEVDAAHHSVKGSGSHFRQKSSIHADPRAKMPQTPHQF